MQDFRCLLDLSLETKSRIKRLFAYFFFSLLSSLFFISSSLGEAPRIISLSPSITEIVFSLGEGGNLVGVTPYCDYPEAAKKIKKVGGLYDANLEQIISLKPSIIISPKEHVFLKNSALLKSSLFKNIKIVSVKQETISEIKESIRIIANSLAKKTKGEQIVKEIEQSIASITKATTLKKTSKKVLVILGSESGADSFYISGKKSIYEEIVKLLGHENAYKGEVEFPSLSVEGLIYLKPDVIINLATNKTPQEINELRKHYLNLPGLSGGAKEGPKKTFEIHFLTNEYIVNPGPRISLTVKDFNQILNK